MNEITVKEKTDGCCKFRPANQQLVSNFYPESFEVVIY